MGWTSCYNWYTPTILRREYVEDITRSGNIKSLGWCGSFLKCIHVPTGRPFVIDVMVRKFGKREYGYKDVEGSSGPGDVNLAAARWLRRELDKRGLAPDGYEADWLLRCNRKAERDAKVKALKPGTVLKVAVAFDTSGGSHFDVGEEFTVDYINGGKIFCHYRDFGRANYRLSPWIFYPLDMWRNYPLVAI